ncbi:acyl-CoA thioesterase [Sphingorhabdus sp. SMR4y]|uniref:acyl-CoA thioesterase n=1 Tax=Sphingorhabdus sp. SMR4y TaxID=2584094 RepID=UPI000B5CCA91|nr:acyl-CoA thioesterase II [Sphingorhabdus sp. SMR4y]ASK87573.1 acyl-CoA thioesterase 2 [Sphingorhabdus sp. SMR4y]
MTQLTDEQVANRLSQALAHRSSVPAEKLVAGLLATFKLTADTADEFTYPALASSARERIFGGQVIAQALVAADHTVDDEKNIHSLHSYFLRAGDETKPLHFRVHRDFDGRSISNRRVVVRQDDKVIFNLTASFQKPAHGHHHQLDMPDVLPPEDCMSAMEQLARNPQVSDEHIERMSMPRPFDVRSFHPEGKTNHARQYQWLKTVAPLPDDPLTHRATLAFASDMGLLSTSMIPHGLHWTTPGLFSTSLDHAMWFHDDFRIDQWICYVMDSDWTGNTRGLNRGSLYRQDGTLVASAVQEGLIRLIPPKS